MIKLFTIGFAGKSAEKFFNLLIDNKVKKVLDIRLNNVSQLAGFAKGADLKYFLKKIGNIDYEHELDYAPSKEIFTKYRDKEITWNELEKGYLKLLTERNILKNLDYKNYNNTCLLCSEDLPTYCHRRILAEYLKKNNKEIEIVHLK